MNSRFVLTSPFKPMIEVDSDNGLSTYMDRVNELSDSDIFTELSNVMASIHNVKVNPVGVGGASRLNDLIFDLETKALNICLFVLGEDIFGEDITGDLKNLVKLINEKDQVVSSLDLEPREHGRQILVKIEEHIKSKKKVSKAKDEIDDFKQLIEIQAINESIRSSPIRVWLKSRDIKLPQQFVLRIDEVVSKKGEKKLLKISNANLNLIASHEPEILIKSVAGFRRDVEGVTCIIAEMVKK